MSQDPSCGDEEELVQTKPVAEQVTPLVQREVEPEEEELIPEEEEEEPIQFKANSAQTPAVTPSLISRINSLKGGGKPLPKSARNYFEPRFGTDFSQVHVHANNQAANTAQLLQAKAYTVGNDIVFNAGQYAPDSHEGKHLLAHELTHVVQQGGLCGNSAEQRNTPDGKQVFKSLINSVNRLQTSPIIQRIIGTDEETSAPPTSGLPIRPGKPLPYREATNLLECIRVMGEENAPYCREQVLGETPSAPTPAPCIPRPVATLDEFRAPTGGSTSAENCCAECPVPLGIGSGGEARHGMEMRIEITNPCPAAYEITRVRENWLWERVGGAWRQLEHLGPGVKDDHHDYDECHTLQRGRFIYVQDRPGWLLRALPAAAAWRPIGYTGVLTDPNATEVVSQNNFAEWVIFRHRGHGIPWTVISSPKFFYWHNVIWLEKEEGNWRLKAGSNRIARGLRRPEVSP